MRFGVIFSAIVSLGVVASSPIESIASRQLPAGLVNLNFSHINAHLTPLSLLTNTINLDFDIAPVIPDLSLVVGVSITHLTFSAGITGTEYVSFDHTFDTPLSVPLTGTANSGTISGVNLTQGFLPTLLNAFSAGTLDIFSAGINAQVTIITNPLTLPLFLPLSQFGVETTWSLI